MRPFKEKLLMLENVFTKIIEKLVLFVAMPCYFGTSEQIDNL